MFHARLQRAGQLAPTAGGAPGSRLAIATADADASLAAETSAAEPPTNAALATAAGASFARALAAVDDALESAPAVPSIDDASTEKTDSLVRVTDGARSGGSGMLPAPPMPGTVEDTVAAAQS